MASVFLSHSSKDKFFARKLADTLRQNGVTVWIDEAELRVGDSLVARIADAIDKADYVAAILSHESVRSKWVQTELQLAMNQEIAGKQVKVLPILIDRCEIPVYLKDKLYADFTDENDFDGPLAKVLHALGVARPTASAVTAKKAEQAAPPVAAAPGLEGFDDIRIVGVDMDKAYRPDETKHLFQIYLELSDHPPQEWVQVFDAERRFPRHTMWRHAWIEGNYIVIHCVPEEVKKFHLNDLKQDVSNSNAKYREYLHRLTAQHARKEAEERKLLDGLSDALDNLDFG